MVLISPLNWGMGHVARCIPLIHQLIQQENKVIIACNESQKQIFLSYFPHLLYENHEGYPFKFNGKGNFGKDLLLRFYKLNKRLKREKKEVEKLIEKHQVELVLSDHRYGFISKKCTSIFITHQLNLPVAWYTKLVDLIHKKRIKPFHFIWVLENPDSKFAGKLSENKTFKNTEYIGPYSRFTMYQQQEKTIPLVVIISGPEPYSKQFFKQQFEIATKKKDKTVFIVPSHYPTKSQFEQIEIIPSSDWKLTDNIILKAKKIVSRSGYSTIMDLNILKTNSELFATKGQAEQEYLLFLQNGKTN
jgi:UDP:flavonoid glycosyltransferase YjiC (YdhE family)